MAASFPPSALPTFDAARHVAPRRSLVSFAPHSGLMTASGALGATCTAFEAWTVPDDAHAVRVVLANDSVNTWTAPLIKFAPSTSFNDYKTVLGGSSWTPFTWTNAGADSSYPVYSSATVSFTMPAAGSADPTTGATDVTSFYFSDWAPIPTTNTTGWTAGAPAYRALFTRTLISNATFQRMQTNLSGLSAATSINNGINYQANLGVGDFVTTTGNTSTSSTGSRFIYGLQYLCRNGGVTVLILGNSHIDGTTSGTSPAVTGLSWAVQAMMSASTPSLPAFPFCVAKGGKDSGTTWPAFMKAVPVVKPGVALIPFTDINDATVALRYQGLSRTFMAAQAVQAQGGVPILWTPLPHPAATGANNAWWLDILARLNATTGYLTFNGANVVGNSTGGVLDGTWTSGLSADNTHPNEAGRNALAAAFAPILSRALTG